MERNEPQSRERMGCGYLPPHPKARLWTFPWAASCVPGGAPEPTMCAGYTTHLPIVREIASARLHWSKGSLGDWAGGPAHEGLMLGIEILEASANAVSSWSMTPKDKGGGSGV